MTVQQRFCKQSIVIFFPCTIIPRDRIIMRYHISTGYKSLFFTLLLRECLVNSLHFLVNVIIELLLIGVPRVPSDTLTPVRNTSGVATRIITSIKVLIDLVLGKCGRGRFSAFRNCLVSDKRLADGGSRAKESIFARDTKVISCWTVADSRPRDSSLLPNKTVELAKIGDTDMRPDVST